jgi:hypothetical protein
MRIITWRFCFAHHFRTLHWLPTEVKVRRCPVCSIGQTPKTPECTNGMKLNRHIFPTSGPDKYPHSAPPLHLLVPRRNLDMPPTKAVGSSLQCPYSLRTRHTEAPPRRFTGDPGNITRCSVPSLPSRKKPHSDKRTWTSQDLLLPSLGGGFRSVSCYNNGQCPNTHGGRCGVDVLSPCFVAYF